MADADAVTLRDATEDDSVPLFALHGDAIAARMAAFGTHDANAEAFAERRRRMHATGTVVFKVIVEADRVVGYVGRFFREGKPEITYWVARDRWGHGIATRALTLLLVEVTERPMHASAVSDNVGSLRVLAKCGFVVTKTERAFADERGEDVTEVFLELA